MSFSKIHLKTLEEFLVQMKEQYNQTYINNTREIIALEHAINYIKLITKEYNILKEKNNEIRKSKLNSLYGMTVTKESNKIIKLEIKGFDNLIEILKDIDNIINIMIKRSL